MGYGQRRGASFRRAGPPPLVESIRETEARCRHFRSCRNAGACFRATAAEDTEANKGGCAKSRPNHLQR